MNARMARGLLLVLVLVIGAALVGALAYNVGFDHGLAQAASATGGSGGATAAVPVRPYWYGPFGFGFGFFGLFFTILFIFLIFALIRAAFGWGGRGRWGGPGAWRGGPGAWADDRSRWGDAPPPFEEWHRRAHGETPPSDERPSRMGNQPS